MRAVSRRFNLKFCCEDYKSLVQAIVSYSNMTETLRKRLSRRIDIKPRPKFKGTLETLTEEEIEARLKELKYGLFTV